MRIHACALAFLGSALCAAALADAATPITAVVLYPGSATVVRTAQVAAGARQVVFSALPGRFDLQTLRAEGSAGVRVGQIVSLDAARAEALNPAEAELEAKILALQDQQGALDAEINSAAMVRNYLTRLSADNAPAPEKQTPALDPKALAGVLDTLGRGASDTLQKMHRLTLQKRDNDKKIEVLQRNLNQLRSGARDSRSVTVSVSADRPGVLKLSYQIPNAGWKPAYRAALDSAASRLEIERLASISQKTGEDWRDVKLTLSTTQPRLSPTGANPQPWLISYQPPVQVQERKNELSGGLYLVAPASPAAAPAPAPQAARDEAAYQPPSFETHSAFATEFVVPTPVTLPSDGREVAVTLAKETLPSRHYLRVAPRLEKAAVVMAQAARPAGVWLAGKTQLFRDGSYVGAIDWNPAGADQFVFSFGRDDLVRVSADEIDGTSGTAGLFGKRMERKVANTFSLTNAHKTPVEVLVLESSPVSASGEIAVQASFEPAPSTQSWEQRRGVVAWEKLLAPNETGKFTVRYTIEHPKDGSVIGLR